MPPLQVCVCNSGPCHLQLLPNQSLPCIEIMFGEQAIVALVDTGAQVPLIDYNFYQNVLAKKHAPNKFTQKKVFEAKSHSKK